MSEGNGEPSSIRDALEKAYREAEEKEKALEAAPEKTKTEPEPTQSKDGTEAAPLQASGETEQTTTDEPPEVIEPPQHWSDEHKETFKGLPPNAQKFLFERHKSMEGDYTRKTTEFANERKRYDALKQVFEPLKDKMTLAGMDEMAAMKQLVAAQTYLDRNPREAIAYFAKTYGVDLSQPDPGASNQDPEMSAVKAELSQLRNHLNLTEQQKALAERQRLDAEITAFSESKDEKGTPKHPHFELLRLRMGALIQSGDAKDLPDAYEKALWADPVLRTDLLEQQRKTAEAKAKAAAQKLAEDAKKKVIPKGGGSSQVQGQEPKSLRDFLSQEYDKQLSGKSERI